MRMGKEKKMENGAIFTIFFGSLLKVYEPLGGEGGYGKEEKRGDGEGRGEWARDSSSKDCRRRFVTR